EIVDVEFTAGMEGNLDDIADGEESWTEILDKFYQPFSKELSHAEQEIGQVELSVEVSDVECDLCGRFMVVKQGRFGSFLACPGYPECRNTKPIVKTIGVNCPKCEGEIIQRKSKKGRVFYGCNKYPKCDFVTWDEPLQETCSVCGAFKVKSKFRNKAEQIKCSNENCSENGSEKKEDVKSKKRSKKNV
ncbi:topoisomerase DNA-binding C4 zinc finger domain-containing protein, partial [Selenomonadales bacterium OttesenSCG-928-I06]|nr:topoisomerase DNA-binding C4 zinc finger domain-containing protein [Selenomonadales bacterium OttesenSCG-928-I06]